MLKSLQVRIYILCFLKEGNVVTWFVACRRSFRLLEHYLGVLIRYVSRISWDICEPLTAAVTSFCIVVCFPTYFSSCILPSTP